MYLYLALLPWFGSLVANGSISGLQNRRSCREY